MSETTTPTTPRAAAPATSFKTALRRLLTQPAFVAAVLVLGIAAVGLNAAVKFLQLHFKKEPVALRQELASLPATLGPWKQVSQDQALEHEIEEQLGTKRYIFRDYVDSRLVDNAAIEAFREKSTKERTDMVNQLRAAHPKAVVRLSVTYYTGLVDTVAHVPDRCYVANAYEPRPGENQFAKWPINGPTAEPVEVRFINFEDQSGRSGLTQSVAYFFHVNGRYESSPLGVRRSLANLLEKHGYYAKVESMTVVKNATDSAQVMTDFLSYAVPEIEKMLPDWDAVQRGEVGGGSAPAVASASNN